jgi:hypothetical protein
MLVTLPMVIYILISYTLIKMHLNLIIVNPKSNKPSNEKDIMETSKGISKKSVSKKKFSTKDIIENPIFNQIKRGIFSPDFIEKMESSRDEINRAYTEGMYKGTNMKMLLSDLEEDDISRIDKALNRWKEKLSNAGAFHWDEDQRPILIIMPHKWSVADGLDYVRGKLFNLDSHQPWKIKEYLQKDSRHEPTYISFREQNHDMDSLKPVRGDVTLLKKYIQFKILV